MVAILVDGSPGGGGLLLGPGRKRGAGYRYVADWLRHTGCDGGAERFRDRLGHPDERAGRTDLDARAPGIAAANAAVAVLVDRLNMRDAPAVKARSLGIVEAGDFLLIDGYGPFSGDGYTWYHAIFLGKAGEPPEVGVDLVHSDGMRRLGRDGEGRRAIRAAAGAAMPVHDRPVERAVPARSRAARMLRLQHHRGDGHVRLRRLRRRGCGIVRTRAGWCIH